MKKAKAERLLGRRKKFDESGRADEWIFEQKMFEKPKFCFLKFKAV